MNQEAALARLGRVRSRPSGGYGTVLKVIVPLVFAAAVGLSASRAMAAGDGPYVAIRGGVSMMGGSDATAPADPLFPSLDATSNPNSGSAMSGAVGYAFDNGWRVEGELGYRENTLDDMIVKSPGDFIMLLFPNFQGLPLETQIGAVEAAKGRWDISGDAQVVALMVNGYYDFDIGSVWRPYVGGGVGRCLAWFQAEDVVASLVDDHDRVFAYQVGVGVGYEMAASGGRPITVSLDYRYFRPMAATFEDDVTGREFEATLDGHRVGIGLGFGL